MQPVARQNLGHCRRPSAVVHGGDKSLLMPMPMPMPVSSLLHDLQTPSPKHEQISDAEPHEYPPKIFHIDDVNRGRKESVITHPTNDGVASSIASAQRRHEFMTEMLLNDGDKCDTEPHNCDAVVKPEENEIDCSDEVTNTSAIDETEELRAREQFCMADFRQKYAMAEALARASMLTSPAAGRRLIARKIEMETADGDFDSEFVPPRQFLIYLVRMGSFNSAPKINNTDSQDDAIVVPANLSIIDLVHHCRIMRGEHLPQLIPRNFLHPSEPHSLISDDITDGLRVLKLNTFSEVCSTPISSPKHLRILQWNILSQSLGQNNDGFVCCPDEALTWECRKYQIVQEIIQNDPDIVCLQEVDHFKFIQRILSTQNYDGVFYPKPDSPCLYIEENNGPDGCAIFFKRSKYELLKFATRVLEVWRVQSNQVAIAVNLRIIETGQEICVSTTHLKARHGALLSKLRNEQGKDLLRFVREVAEERPTIVCGDFNAEPVEPVYNTVLNFKSLELSSAYSDLLNECTSDGDQTDEDDMAHIKNKTECDNNEEPSTFTAAELSAAKEPEYTTWKIREDGEVCHTIDYVFYTKDKINVKNCLMFPEANDLGKDRAPSFNYPSDHFSLVCDFELKDKQ